MPQKGRDDHRCLTIASFVSSTSHMTSPLRISKGPAHCSRTPGWRFLAADCIILFASEGYFRCAAANPSLKLVKNASPSPRSTNRSSLTRSATDEHAARRHNLRPELLWATVLKGRRL